MARAGRAEPQFPAATGETLADADPTPTSRHELALAEMPPPSYLPGLDGLRALAVVAVLLFHAGTGWLPGGFLGVDVFFVISGYIITRGLLQEWRVSRRVDIAGFWLRRARRLRHAPWLLIRGRWPARTSRSGQSTGHKKPAGA